jgi:hypothetical protein
MRPPSPCVEPGCPVLVTGGGRCTEHRYHRPNGRDGTDAAWRKARARAIRRDGGRCTRCRSTGPLEVHHLDGDWRNNQPENLESLCRPCHRAAEGTRGATRNGPRAASGSPGPAKAAMFQPRGVHARPTS